MEQLKIYKDSAGKLNLEVNNVKAALSHFYSNQDADVILSSMDKYGISADEFNEIYSILKFINK